MPEPDRPMSEPDRSSVNPQGGRLLPRRWGELALQVAFWFSFLALYQLARGVADRDPAKAFANGLRVIGFEREFSRESLELGLQHFAQTSRILSDVSAWTYWHSEFTVVGLALLWVYLRRREAFTRFRNTILLANGIGLIGYFVLPTAPPRLFPDLGYVDSLSHFGGLNRGSGFLQIATDPYAAMPSLHAADALIVGVTLALVVRRPLLKALWLLWPGWVWFCVLATGNHYWLDVFAGITVALVAMVVLRLPLAASRSRTRVGGTCSTQAAAPMGHLGEVGRSVPVLAVSALGPLLILAGIVWAVLQPYRLTFLHPDRQSFWWLAIEPPLLVVAIGVFFLLVTRGVIRDLKRGGTP